MVIIGNAEHIDIVDCMANDFAFGAVVLNHCDFSFDHFRFLESQLSRQRHHFLLQLEDEFARVAFEDLMRLLNVF